jgi:pyruvate dehydrogenase E2 component (dihydrolipoamide acetyltransferase)
MATKVMMEALSPTMEEGRLAKWLKQEGDRIASGDVLAEVETDKAIMELVARGDGVLRARLLAEEATAPVGQLIGVIAAPDEDIAALVGGVGAPTASAPATSAPATSAPATSAPAATAAAAPAAAPATGASAAAAPSPAAPADGGRVKASPLARRLASEAGVSLSTVQGSGPGGRVVRRDVEAAASGATVAAPAALSAPSAPAPAAAPVTAKAGGTPPAIPVAPAMAIEGDARDVALTQMRKTIARRLTESIGPVPTFYLTSEIDMHAVVALREQMAASGDAFKVSVNDVVLKAVATALAKHPECNAHWLGDTIRYHARVHLGMAVATDDGLIVPVIRDADRKGLGAIGREAKALATRARERKLTPAEYTGSTFSVSNLGMFGIDQFTAIINPPEAAILAVGATETKPVWDGTQFVPRPRMRVTLSCDHRVIDGAVGARFLQTVRHLLEHPYLMLY